MKKLIQSSIFIALLLAINLLECSQSTKSDTKESCAELYQAMNKAHALHYLKNNGDCLGSIRLQTPLSQQELNRCEMKYNQQNKNKINAVMFPDGGIFLFANKE